MKSKKFIYADNAATTKLDPMALEAMLPYLQGNFANPSNLYSFSRSVKLAIQKSRERIAQLLHFNPTEIFFTASGTESINWALKGIAESLRDKGNHIITSEIEHHAVLNTCKHLEKFGFKITILPVDIKGHIDVALLQKSISPQTILISIMFANNEIGTLQNVQKIGALARKNKILFHTDAVQAVGHVPIDVQLMNIDLLSASAHKFNGPKGVGFLYKKEDILIAPLLDGGQQESGLRAGTENVASIVGMAKALEQNISHLETNVKHLINLENTFKNTLHSSVQSIQFNGDNHHHLHGLISLSIPFISAEKILHLLDLKGIYISAGAACNSHTVKISHVLNAIGLNNMLARSTLRVSFGKDNTIDDATYVAHAIAHGLHILKNK